MSLDFVMKKGIVTVILLSLIGIGTLAHATSQAFCDNIWPGTKWNGRSCEQTVVSGSKSNKRLIKSANYSISKPVQDGQAVCDNIAPGTRWDGYSCNKRIKPEFKFSGSLSGGGFSSGSSTGIHGSGGCYASSSSGACSSHGGVNCAAGPDADGSVICNDGWTDSSVRYIRR